MGQDPGTNDAGLPGMRRYLAAVFLSACFNHEEVAGVPVTRYREFQPGEPAALRRVITGTPDLLWPDISLYLVEEEPGEGPKPGGLTFPSRPPVRIYLDPRDPACVLIHEMVSHVGPGLSGLGWNREHTIKELAHRETELISSTSCKL